MTFSAEFPHFGALQSPFKILDKTRIVFVKNPSNVYVSDLAGITLLVFDIRGEAFQ